jgi:16S rRNA (uracil1498-N3)-methyltransferase
MTIHRLYLPDALHPHAIVPCSPEQAHHLRHVLRLSDGTPLEVMNGVDGTWQATLALIGKRDAQLALGECIAPQRSVPDIWLVCWLKKLQS